MGRLTDGEQGNAPAGQRVPFAEGGVEWCSHDLTKPTEALLDGTSTLRLRREYMSLMAPRRPARYSHQLVHTRSASTPYILALPLQRPLIRRIRLAHEAPTPD